eukprot:CAMPEP_0167777266 /NCGR_PEP_ID=MMETSP0111_2-20121227/3597_1 /TAXON_ID=91324 /ORGANISM="Lotharella globosa, Strain CCCM811" /LENGTH=372 /DNA_ID=CAMNT_0007667429 /DNA_START=133 /DNA_END=1251 /DNA_ORIENTATION=-
MDGTLTVPNLDFKEMYERCGVAPSEDVLEAIAAMSPQKAAAAKAVIDEMEAEGRRTLKLEPGAIEFARWLQFHGIPTALVTRNTKTTVDHLHAHLWEPAGLPRFDPAISRDDASIPAKPKPGALEAIAKAWGMPLGEEVLMVGDSPSNDVAFGKDAGTTTALVDSGRRFVEGSTDGGADFVVEGLHLLPHRLWTHFEIVGPNAGGLVKYPSPNPPVTAAAKAAAAGDAKALADLPVDQLLTEEEGEGQNPPIVWAAENGSEECIDILLKAGVDVDKQGYLGATAICRASRSGHVEALKRLLAAGGNPDIPNIKRQYPLHFAAFKLNHKAVDVLLAHGASTICLDRKGRTPAEDTSDANIRARILEARRKRGV